MQNYQSNKYLNSKERQESEQQLISWWVLVFGLAAAFGLYIGSAELARTAAITFGSGFDLHHQKLESI